MQRGVRAERGSDRALRAQLHAQAAAGRALRVLRRRERRRERRAHGIHEAHAERRARVPHAALARRLVHCGLSRAHLQPHVHGMRRVARLVSLLCRKRVALESSIFAAPTNECKLNLVVRRTRTHIM